jgi:hypothetical protein
MRPQDAGGAGPLAQATEFEVLDIDETIDAFRRGFLDIDCKRMVLTQHKEGGERFEGKGYIRQTDDGKLIFKIYVTRYNAKPLGHLEAMVNSSAGKMHSDEVFYDFEAAAHDGTRWTATRILPVPHWDMTDQTVLMHGTMQSITADLDMPQKRHYLVLHFFEEYHVSLHRMSETERHGNRYYTRDRAEFTALESEFEVRVRDGSGDTIFEIASDRPFPTAFDLRVQEALQYITAKTAIWRVRFQSTDKGMELELASPWRKSSRTQFSPPLAPISARFMEHGWKLFERYLDYVVQKTDGTHWNPVAYHLHNACEATANSVDAWAVGVSVAVEAVTGLISVRDDKEKAARLALYQERARKWLEDQKDLADIADRARGQINAMSNKRPQDTLYALAETGHVEKSYVDAWKYLRNRHVHPKLKDLQKPSPVDYQKLLDYIHRVETLLRQLTFYLIGYEGWFTDYGDHGKHAFASKQYPLSAEKAAEG